MQEDRSRHVADIPSNTKTGSTLQMSSILKLLLHQLLTQLPELFDALRISGVFIRFMNLAIL